MYILLEAEKPSLRKQWSMCVCVCVCVFVCVLLYIIFMYTVYEYVCTYVYEFYKNLFFLNTVAVSLHPFSNISVVLRSVIPVVC